MFWERKKIQEKGRRLWKGGDSGTERIIEKIKDIKGKN